MEKTRLIVLAVCAAALMGVGASAAFAGEVKGKPLPAGSSFVGGCVDTGNCQSTAIEGHANSFCAFSGLNDYDSTAGQITKRTQTPADGAPGNPATGINIGTVENPIIFSCNPNTSDIPAK
jgi:hypothetical protein